MSIEFTGKRVLVTGATRGIGRAIAEAFLKAGAKVAVNGSSQETVGKAARTMGAPNRTVEAPGDLSTVEGCRRTVELALSGLGGMDVLVNNAGRWNFATVESAAESSWDEIIDVNLKGAFFVTKYALPALRTSKGNIVNVASISGLSAEPGTSIYCLSKAGLIHMTRCHAWEFGPDVRVNAVCPGPIDTDMLRRVSGAFFDSADDGYRLMAKDCALKRLGNVSDIAGPVLYVASDLAGYATGTVQVIDGGMSID
jgi:meso-butanediol dehydrogenase/(S,S)-butanediol dehydrogenase/diacetyl reductase